MDRALVEDKKRKGQWVDGGASFSDDASELFEGLDSRAGVCWVFLKVVFFFVVVCLQSLSLEFDLVQIVEIV